MLQRGLDALNEVSPELDDGAEGWLSCFEIVGSNSVFVLNESSPETG